MNVVIEIPSESLFPFLFILPRASKLRQFSPGRISPTARFQRVLLKARIITNSLASCNPFALLGTSTKFRFPKVSKCLAVFAHFPLCLEWFRVVADL